MMGNIPMYEFPKNDEGFKKIWEQVGNDLGMNDMNMDRDRPYIGQEHTMMGKRGETEIKGITFRDMRDCFIRAAFLCANEQFQELYEEADKGESAALCENDMYKLDWNELDPMAICQNLACEIERIMGIFPNVPSLKENPEEE
jgi:hypothetical protein